MSNDDNKNAETTVSHTTNIGSVTGQVHSGSGNIIVKSLSLGPISNADEFLSALTEFKAGLNLARHQGFDNETVDDALVEVEAAEREVKKVSPKADRIAGRLERAKSIIVSSTGVATAISGAVAAATKLIPMLENALHAINKIF